MSATGRKGHRLRLLAVVASAVLSIPSFGTAEPERGREYQLKAAFLFNFTRFVEWPRVREPAKGEEFRLCVVSDTVVADEIVDAVGGKLRVQRLSKPGSVRPCHLVFVAESRRRDLAEFAAAAQKWGALLVSEADGFGEAIGMINLVVVENRIRIEVDLKATERASLRVSSRLLSLATLTGKGE